MLIILIHPIAYLAVLIHEILANGLTRYELTCVLSLPWITHQATSSKKTLKIKKLQSIYQGYSI